MFCRKARFMNDVVIGCFHTFTLMAAFSASISWLTSLIWLPRSVRFLISIKDEVKIGVTPVIALCSFGIALEAENEGILSLRGLWSWCHHDDIMMTSRPMLKYPCYYFFSSIIMLENLQWIVFSSPCRFIILLIVTRKQDLFTSALVSMILYLIFLLVPHFWPDRSGGKKINKMLAVACLLFFWNWIFCTYFSHFL